MHFHFMLLLPVGKWLY